jgi:hypothetical protein
LSFIIIYVNKEVNNVYSSLSLAGRISYKRLTPFLFEELEKCDFIHVLSGGTTRIELAEMSTDFLILRDLGELKFFKDLQ